MPVNTSPVFTTYTPTSGVAINIPNDESIVFVGLNSTNAIVVITRKS